MQPAPRRRDALLGVQRRRAADDDQIQRIVREKGFEVAIDGTTVTLGQLRRLFRVVAIKRGDLKAFNFARGPRMRIADAAATHDAEMFHQCSAPVLRAAILTCQRCGRCRSQYRGAVATGSSSPLSFTPGFSQVTRSG